MFKNLLIADSGKGHIEEMVRMLQDIPSFKAARINLLHVVPEQSKADSDQHLNDAQVLLNNAVTRMGLVSGSVNPIIRQGDAKQTVLKVADEVQADLDEAIPALNDALKALDTIKPADIDEVRKLAKPPATGVPVPGAKAGSSPSISNDKYTGLPAAR